MDFSINVGERLKREITVDQTRVITFLGEDLEVYETPSMIADIEYACRDLLASLVPDGWDSVGVIVDIEHLAATPKHERVEVSVEIESVEGRRVRFRCEVNDAVELVGRGRHDRFVINKQRHRERLQGKREKLGA